MRNMLKTCKQARNDNIKTVFQQEQDIEDVKLLFFSQWAIAQLDLPSLIIIGWRMRLWGSRVHWVACNLPIKKKKKNCVKFKFNQTSKRKRTHNTNITWSYNIIECLPVASSGTSIKQKGTKLSTTILRCSLCWIPSARLD